MLETFAEHLKIVQEVFREGVPGWEEATKPKRFGSILVFSFLEDIEFALTFSPFQIEIHSVGNLQRVKEDIVFSPHPLLLHEIDTKQLLLDGRFWRVLCRVDREEEMFYVPSRLTDVRMHSTARLQEVAEHILTVCQRHNAFFHDISLETLRRGLCLTIHDAICGGDGFYLEKIGTFFPNGHFEPDHFLFAKIPEENNTPSGDQCSFGFPASRRQTRNRGMYYH